MDTTGKEFSKFMVIQYSYISSLLSLSCIWIILRIVRMIYSLVLKAVYGFKITNNLIFPLLGTHREL